MTGQDDRTVVAWRRSCAALAATGAALLLWGCGPREQPPLIEPVELSLDDPVSADPVGQTPEALAAQAERDVEAFLAAQRPPVEPTTNASIARPIEWNEPGAAPPPTPEEKPIVLGRPEEYTDDVTDLTPPEATAAADDPPPTPAQALQIDRLDALVVDLTRELYLESSYADMPLRELLVIAALSVVKPERELSVEHVPGLTDREREVLTHFQAFFRRLGGDLGTEDMDALIEQSLADLQSALHPEPALQIASAALCYQVDGFGDFDPFDRNSFMAHSEQGIVIYMEIENFTSQLNEHGQWVTELAQQLVIYSDRDGIPVWSAEWQPAVDISRNRRQDFFTVQVITLPAALGVGRYHLKMRVRDEKSRAEAETSIQFEMVADSKLAARVPK